MASLTSLHLARHLLRREHQSAAKTGAENLDVIATAHEEICELLANTTLLSVLCHLSENNLGHGQNFPLTTIMGSAIGLAHPLVLDMEAAATRGVHADSPADGSSIAQRPRDRN
jgi:hypothetical protein